MRRAAGGLLAVLAVLSLGLSSGCSVELRAEQVQVRIDNASMKLDLPKDRPIKSGEVVIKIENYTYAKRQIVLARTTLDPGALPQKLATALRGQDHKDVVSVTAVMRSAKTELVGILPGTVPSVTTLHVNLKRGESYLLFDRLGGLAAGQSLRITAT
jgi:hypothetical protein